MTHLRVIADRPDGLCASCAEGQIVEFANGATETYCHELGVHQPFRILRPVSRCSHFLHMASPTKYEMEKIAWELKTDRGGKVLGFAPPKKED